MWSWIQVKADEANALLENWISAFEAESCEQLQRQQEDTIIQTKSKRVTGSKSSSSKSVALDDRDDDTLELLHNEPDEMFREMVVNVVWLGLSCLVSWLVG